MGKKVWFPVVSGSPAPYAAGYGRWLRSRAYSPSAAADRLRQFGQVSRWPAADRCTSAAVHGRDPDAPGRRVAAGGRPGAALSRAEELTTRIVSRLVQDRLATGLRACRGSLRASARGQMGLSAR